METSIKIFIVDDDEFSLNMYGQFLKKSGFQNIELFNDGERCYKKLNERPALIFLDHMMDDFNGMDLLQKIKKWDPNIPVVIVSAQESLRTAVNYIKQGAYDYITKGDDELLRMKTIARRISELQTEEIEKPKFRFNTSFVISVLLLLVLTEIPLVLVLNYMQVSQHIMVASALLGLMLVGIFFIFRPDYRIAGEDV